MSKRNVLSNLIWRFLERIGAQAVTLVVTIILGNILDPKLFGEIEIVTVLITILQVFVDSGLGNALIQKKNTDELDYSTVFYFNIISCGILYIVLFFMAHPIAFFYRMPELESVIKVLGLIVVISGVKNIQQAYVSRNMLFKKFFFSTLAGTIIAAIVGIIMALKGFGVWALVFQHLINTTIDTLILWITVKWRPKRCFSWERFKGLFSYGWKMLISQLITVSYNNIRQLIIGKKYDADSLAFYNKGDKIPGLLVNNIHTAIDSVLFPSMSLVQDSALTVKRLTKRAITTSSYILMPLMTILAICSENLIKLLLPDTWLPCVPFLRIFCLIYAFYPLHSANLSAIRAMGKSEIYLKLEIIKDVIGIIFIIFTFRISVLAMALGYLVTSLIATVINSWPNKKLINYGYFEQIKDLLPSMILSCISGTIIYFINYLPIWNFAKIMMQGVIGISIYILLSRILKLETFYYVIESIKSLIMKTKENKND